MPLGLYKIWTKQTYLLQPGGFEKMCNGCASGPPVHSIKQLKPRVEITNARKEWMVLTHVLLIYLKAPNQDLEVHVPQRRIGGILNEAEYSQSLSPHLHQAPIGPKGARQIKFCT